MKTVKEICEFIKKAPFCDGYGDVIAKLQETLGEKKIDISDLAIKSIEGTETFYNNVVGAIVAEFIGHINQGGGVFYTEVNDRVHTQDLFLIRDKVLNYLKIFHTDKAAFDVFFEEKTVRVKATSTSSEEKVVHRIHIRFVRT